TDTDRTPRASARLRRNHQKIRDRPRFFPDETHELGAQGAPRRVALDPGDAVLLEEPPEVAALGAREPRRGRDVAVRLVEEARKEDRLELGDRAVLCLTVVERRGLRALDLVH